MRRPCLICGTPTNGSRCPAHRIHRNRGGRTTRTVRATLSARDGDLCAHCGGPGPYQIDHVIPLADNGPDTLENLRLLCRTCHNGAHRID